nr:DUF4384 domain-containing protein [Scytonema sp. UIC 10036]
MLRGRIEYLLKAETGESLLRAQELLFRTEELLAELLIVPISQSAADEFERLRAVSKLRKIGRADLLIASISLANRATLVTIASSKKIVSETLPTRGFTKTLGASTATPAKPINIKDGEIPKLPLATQVIFEVENKESVPLYISILVIDAAGEMAVIFPNDWSASEDAALLPARDKQIIPGENDGFKLTIGEPLGITEALIIASTSPLRTSLKVLKEIATRGNTTRGPLSANNDEFLDVTDKLLEDLDAGTRGGINVEGVQLAANVRGVDTKKLAAMAIAFEVVS